MQRTKGRIPQYIYSMYYARPVAASIFSEHGGSELAGAPTIAFSTLDAICGRARLLRTLRVRHTYRRLNRKFLDARIRRSKILSGKKEFAVVVENLSGKYEA